MRQKAIVAGVVCALVAAPALGAVKYFRPSGSQAAWTDNVWFDSPTGGSLVSAPTATDRAVILGGKTCVVGGAKAADTIDIEVDAELQIGPGASLTLDNDTGPTSHSIIDGLLSLITDSNGAGALYIIEASHDFAGDGGVRGDTSSTLVWIDETIRLTNLLDGTGFAAGFHGAMTILGNNGGRFHNVGVVRASGGGTQELVLDAATSLSDSGTVDLALWAAESGTLAFEGNASLAGEIAVFCHGALIVEGDVLTCGSFTWDAGHWEVASGVDFNYVTFNGFSNPGTEICAPGACDCFRWVISDDEGTIVCPG